MIDQESIKTAAKTLQSQGWRTSLTVLAIVLGITAIITLVSLGEGLNASVTKQFQSMGTDTLVVLPGKGFVESAFAQLRDDDDETIETVRGVSFAAEIYIASQQMEYKGERKTRLVIGIDPAQMSQMNIIGLVSLESGRVLSPRDQTAVMVGPRLAEKTFEKIVYVNNEIKMNDAHYRVVARLSKATNSFYGNFMDNAVILNSDQLTKIQPGIKPNRIFVKLDEGVKPDDVKERIENELELRHNQTDFQVMTPSQVGETAGSVIGLIQTILVGIAAISLVVGGVGVMNTMYMSVTERTSEVGVMKAIGAGNEQIRDIFLTEAALIGIIGGIIGTILGVGLATIITIAAHYDGFGLAPL